MATEEPIPLEYAGDARPQSDWLNRLAWILLIALGWLIFELTLHPGLAAVVVCAKFGWNDYLTARWLRRRDYNSGRGWTCYAFYLASALWKIAAGAFLVTVVIVIASINLDLQRAQQGQGADNGLEAVLRGTMLETLIALVLSAVTTYVALALAFICGVRIWLDSAAHRARRENVWPPPYWKRNRAMSLLLTALLPLLTAALLVTAVIVGNRMAQIAAWTVPVVGMSSLVVGAIGILVLRDALARRVVARTPWECWGADGLEEELQ